MALGDSSLIECQPEVVATICNPISRIPRPAQARLLLHGLEVNSPFMAALNEMLPNEATRLAYLNHLAWQARS